MSEIGKIRIPPRIDRLPLAEKEIGRETPKGWNFEVEGQKFEFIQGKLHLNGQDLAKHIAENLTHLSANYWTTLSKRLALYRDWATMSVEDTEALGKFLALIHAYLTQIYGRIKRKFDETIDGVSFRLEDGQLFINGINVHSCLKMAKRQQTRKGWVFLKGIRARLAVLQSNRTGNTSYEKIRATVDRLAEAIDAEVKAHPTVIELPPPLPQLES
jgi:hypothetical protein